MITLIEQQNDVQSIELEETYQPALESAAAAMDALKVWTRTTSTGEPINGAGVKVAVVEQGGIYFAHTNLKDGSHCQSTVSAPNGLHATEVAGTINSNDPTNRGIAYGGPALLSGNTIDFSDSEIIKCTDWAINNGANVINWSFGADTQGALSALSRYGDYVVRNRHKTLTVAAGNISNVGGNCSGSNYVSSPGTGFNMITVGSYVDQGTVTNDDDTVSTSSCYEDPISFAGDRQKPEVAAPGVNIVTTCNSSLAVSEQFQVRALLALLPLAVQLC